MGVTERAFYRIVIAALVVILAGVVFYAVTALGAKETQASPPTDITSGNVLSIFQGWEAWPSSSNQKPDDTTPQALYLMGQPEVNQVSRDFKSLVDYNGDGLTDLVYHEFNSGADGFGYFAILLNKGTGFDVAYRCVASDLVPSGPTIWYGDCADLP